jgi:hypothetical protein
MKVLKIEPLYQVRHGSCYLPFVPEPTPQDLQSILARLAAMDKELAALKTENAFRSPDHHGQISGPSSPLPPIPTVPTTT